MKVTWYCSLLKYCCNRKWKIFKDFNNYSLSISIKSQNFPIKFIYIRLHYGVFVSSRISIKSSLVQNISAWMACWFFSELSNERFSKQTQNLLKSPQKFDENNAKLLVTVHKKPTNGNKRKFNIFSYWLWRKGLVCQSTSENQFYNLKKSWKLIK